jgi:O-antigen/teichoic acid export membrane protein
MKYTKTIIYNLITKILRALTAFIISIITARAFGAEGKGFITYFLLIFTLIATYGHLGVHNATSYFTRKSNFSANTVYNVNITYAIMVSILISVILAILYFNKIIFQSYNSLIFVSGIAILNFIILGNVLRSIHIADNNNNLINISFIFSNFLKLFLIIALFLIEKFEIHYYVLIISLEAIISVIILFKKRYSIELNFKLIVAQFKYGIYGFLAGLLIFLNYRADMLIIRHLLGNESLGIYTVAVTLAEIVFLIPHSIDQALQGKLLNIKTEKNDIKRIFSSTFKLTFYFSFFIGLIGTFFSFLIPYVYGYDFNEAIYPSIILMFGVVFASVAKISASFFYSQGDPKRQTIAAALVLTINIGLNIFLIPILGITGAAISSTVAYVIYGLYYFIVFYKTGIFSIGDLIYLKKDDFRNIIFILKTITKNI